MFSVFGFLGDVVLGVIESCESFETLESFESWNKTGVPESP